MIHQLCLAAKPCRTLRAPISKKYNILLQGFELLTTRYKFYIFTFTSTQFDYG